MKCHYEILNIARDADPGEIKTAYRKLALKWHPDKNLEEPDLAKQQFQLVQQAYEVLSDQHERAWYDNHREDILRGGQTNFEDNSLDVFQYFTSSCFKGYDDSPESFYSVYSEVFCKLASEDIEYMDDPDEYESIPRFGNSKSSYDVVHLFYSYWQSYSTKKSYAWLSPYNVNETRDRRVLKLIDKENKKVQQKARRERNEQVRQLVQFVRKRDKRVIAQRKIEEERAKQNKSRMESMRKEQMRLRREELVAQVQSLEMHDLESRLREIERNLSEEFGNTNSDDSDQEIPSESTNEQSHSINGNKDNGSISDVKKENNGYSDEYLDNLYCVACNKIFKTTSSFENHEKSKKHKERVAILAQEMQESEEGTSDSFEENCEELQVDSEYPKYDIKNTDINCINDGGSESDNNGELYDTITPKAIPKSKTKNKQKSKSKAIIIEDEEISENNFKHISSEDENVWDSKSKGKQKKIKTKNKVKTEESKVFEDNESEPSKTVKKSLDKKDTNLDQSIDVDHVCVTCKQNFASKNKLFSHLKTSGHGVALNQKHDLKKDKKSKKR